MPSKVTLESDAITIRRLFALNPATQGYVPEGQIPSVGLNGQVVFYSTIEYFSTISSATATESVYSLLSQVQPGLSSISTQNFTLTSSLTSTFQTLTLSTFSSLLNTSVNYPLTSSLAGLGSLGYVSSVFAGVDTISVFGFTLNNGPNSVFVSLSSPYMQINNDYLPTSTSLISTAAGVGSMGYLSTQINPSSINFRISSVRGYELGVIGEVSTFNEIIFNGTGDIVTNIKYGSSLWFANTATIGGYWSSNVDAWTLADVNLKISVDYDAVANKWLAGGTTTPYYSSDGFSWTQYTTPYLTYAPNSIETILHTIDGWYVAGIYASGSNNSSIMFSATGNDDTNWLAMQGNVGLDFVRGIAYNANLGSYMAVGSDITQATYNILVSSDGINWDFVTNNPATNVGDTLESVATDTDETWVILGQYNGAPSIYTTTDFGTTWTTQTFGGYIGKVYYKNGKFYILNTDINVSTDGLTWTTIPFPGNPINNIYTMDYHADTYVIGGLSLNANSSIATSIGSDSNWSFKALAPYNSTFSTILSPLSPGQMGVKDTTSTIVTLSTIQSSIVGLGSVGYISSQDFASFMQGLGSFGLQSTLTSTLSSLVVNYSTILLSENLTSTTIAISTTGFLNANNTEIQYVSTFRSTIQGLDPYGFINFKSTTEGLGSLGYISTSQLVSSFSNLVPYGYVSQGNLNSTIVGLDGFTDNNVSNSNSFLRIPPPYQSTASFGLFTSSITIKGSVPFSTPIHLNTSRLFSTIQLDVGGYHNILLPTSKLTIEVPVNTSFSYFNTQPQDVFHSWYFRDANGVKRGDCADYTIRVSSLMDSNIRYGTLKYHFDYHDMKFPYFASTYTLMVSTSATIPFSTIMTMNVPSTSVLVQLNNLNR